MTTKLAAIAAKIKASTGLNDLLRSLVEFETEARRSESDGYDPNTESLLEYNGVDIAQLPTFGGKQPRNTDSCWSWDEDRLLVGEGPFKDWEIFDRDDESQAWRA